MDKRVEEDGVSRFSISRKYTLLSLGLLLILLIIGFFASPRVLYKTAKEVSYTCTDFCWLPGANEENRFEGIKLQHNNYGVKIVNTSSDSWTDCDIISVGDYFYDGSPTINPKSTLNIKYSDFTRRGDIRLNTKVIKPSDFSIQCDVNGNHKASKFTLQ